MTPEEEQQMIKDAQKRVEERRSELGIKDTSFTKTAANSLEATLERMNLLAASMTPEQKQAALDLREKREREYQEERMMGLMKSSEAPKRHIEKKALESNGEWQKQFEKLGKLLGTGFMAALVGIRGNGKTQLAVELIRWNARNGIRSRYCSAMTFFMEVKASYKEEGEGEMATVEHFQHPAFLSIDEIGHRSENDWENRLLYELLNRRYNDVKDTLLITNQDAATLEASLGPSIISRMNETGGIIQCNWPSFRA